MSKAVFEVYLIEEPLRNLQAFSAATRDPFKIEEE
jgi:hypothetical protein